LAWPPKMPCVPTCNATPVTSEANADSWSTMELTVPSCLVRFSDYDAKSAYPSMPTFRLLLESQSFASNHGGSSRRVCDRSYFIHQREAHLIDLQPMQVE
jgi:hypothetical protein